MDLIAGNDTAINFGFDYLFKIAFSMLLLLYILYSYFLALRVKILADTVRTPWNASLQRLAFSHLYVVILVGLLALFFIVLA